MKKTAPNAFTLIELVVAITIIAIIGVFVYANYKPFGEDQNLKNAVLDLQSQLRTAQTNATTNLKCNTQFGATWQVEYTDDRKTINLKCREPLSSPSPSPLPTPFLKKTLQLGTNITIDSVTGAVGCEVSLPLTISFDPLSSKANFEGSTNCTSLGIKLKNSQTGSTKFLTIEQGGRIYAP